MDMVNYNKDVRWTDDYGIRYFYRSNYNCLVISVNDFFPSNIGYIINSLSTKYGNIILKVNCKENAINGINMLLKDLSRTDLNKDVIVNLCDNKFSFDKVIDFHGLSNKVKIGIGEFIYPDGKEILRQENSLDWWSLNLSDEDFVEFVKTCTPDTKNRVIKLRKIAKDFYDSFPDFDSYSDLKKANIAYLWCQKNTSFDNEFSNGRLKNGFGYAQDPIKTYERKLGICAGRARLMKVLLNNYYANVNCFLTTGYNGNIQHEWNEVIINGKRLYYDLNFAVREGDEFSLFKKGHHGIEHRDYELNKSLISYKKKK